MTLSSQNQSLEQSFNQSTNTPNNQSLNLPINQSNNQIRMLQYSFIMPLLINLLTDSDVLVRLLLTGKCMKQPLIGYRLKSSLDVSNAARYFCEKSHRYLPVLVTRIHEADGDDLSMHKHLEKLKYCIDFGDPFTFKTLPASLKVIRLGRNFDNEIRRGALPSGLRELWLGRDSAKALSVGAMMMIPMMKAVGTVTVISDDFDDYDSYNDSDDW